MISTEESAGSFSDPNEDNMANNWGTHYVGSVTVGSTSSSGGCRDVSYQKFDTLVRTTIPGYRLHAVLDSGTTANERALGIATDFNTQRCLIAMGSYVGGVGAMEDLSSTKSLSNYWFSMVQRPEDTSDLAQELTVAFPYHIPTKDMDQTALALLEERCLVALETKILCSKIDGQPYKAILLEYILSGSGGILSKDFLMKLGLLLKRFDMVAIVDEIMTGGRVGPTMVMTTGMPKEFTQCAEFLTMGKVFGCGLLLIADSSKRGLGQRGTSTKLSAGFAYNRFAIIAAQLSASILEKKRAMVFEQCGLEDTPFNEIVWGVGLLLFCMHARSQIMNCLKCRLLPTIECYKGLKMKRGFKPTPWTRSEMSAYLWKTCERWLQHADGLYDRKCVSPFKVAIARYIQAHPAERVLCPSEISRELEEDKTCNVAVMVATFREQKKRRLGRRHGRCSARYGSLVTGALVDAVGSSNGFITTRERTCQRTTKYLVSLGDSGSAE